MTLKEHQLGDGALDSAVVAADDTGFLKVVTCVVAGHLNGSLHTLANIDDYFTVARTLLEGIEQPRRLWGIATAEGAHDDSLQIGSVNDVADEVLADAWKQREDDDVVV